MAEMKRVWDNFETIGEVKKTDRVKFVVSAAARDGYRYVVIREFYFAAKSGMWHPAKDGVMIPLMVPLKNNGGTITPAMDLFKLYKEAMLHASKMDLMNEDNMVFIERKQKNAD